MPLSEQPKLFVRSFRAGDENDMMHVFEETADQGLRDNGTETLRIASYAWCRPYYLLQPENCFVVDDGRGKAVGYIIGTPDTRTFVKMWHEKFLPFLDQEGLHQPGADEKTSWTENINASLRKYLHDPDQLLHEDWPELMQEYPGHLHIDILPAYQRFGMGRKLMEVFLAHMRKHGSAGLHLGMVSSNGGAEKFYKRMGFGRFPKVIDQGASGEQGVIGSTMYLVTSL